jgi:general secretion pathway protein D
MWFRWRRARSAAAVALVLLLCVPSVALAQGKKAYKKGIEFEEAQRWDRAAEQFAIALADDPDNNEYKLHYFRAVTNSSIMLTQRGDMLAGQKDYSAAYHAYRQAYTYDQTNELAKAKMNYMRKLLNLPEEEDGPEQGILKAKYKRNPATLQIPASKRVLTDVVYRNASLKSVIDSLAESVGLNVIYDKDFKDDKNFDFEARNVTKAKALELILLTNKLFYVQADTRTVIIAPDQPQNRARYQNLAVRTYYLRNAEAEQVRTLIQQIVSTKYVVPSKQLNALTVRDTPANLELIESLIASIDKDRAEVLIEVNLYEVDHQDLLQIGNQFNVATKGLDGIGSLATFIGGIGVEESLRPFTPAGAWGPIGLGIALPRSFLTAFQSKASTKLLASTQVHVLDNEQHTIRIGQRVPIQTASFVGTGTTVVDGGNRPNQNPNFSFGTPATQFQYENVGLNIDMQPVVHEDMVQIKMKIETSDVGAEGVGGNPIFTQRTMSSVASIRNGNTTLIAGVATENKTKSVQGLPLLSLLPGIGRFFATPREQKSTTDVVITVTPHILRAPVYSEEDNLAVPAGTQTAPDRQISIEEIVYRAEIDEAEAASPPIATAGQGGPPGTPARAAPAQPRPGATSVDVTFPGAPNVNRPVSTAPGETVRTPGGAAAAPVVAPEEQAPAQAMPATSPPPDAALEEDDEGEDDDWEDADEEPSASAKTPPPDFSIRLSGMKTGAVGRPMPVAVWAAGGAGPTTAKIAIRFDERILKIGKVQSTGLFDGKLGGELPFEVSNGMVVISLTRPPEMAGRPINGQLVNIMFEVIGGGTATLAVVPDASALSGPDNLVARVSAAADLTVTAR